MTGDTNRSFLGDLEVDEIAISVLSRVREMIFGDHKSVFTGQGFDFSGLREWQPGDRQVSVDWAHSTHTGFSPLIVRECVEERSVDVWLVADNSLSVRCGIGNETVGNIIARTIATIGFSGVVFQDRIGLIAFDGKNYLIEAPKGGKKQVHRIVDIYHEPVSSHLIPIRRQESIARIISGSLKRTSLVVVVSDFLFSEAELFIKELTDIRSGHDLFLVMADASFPFEFNLNSGGWVEGVDAETGQLKLLSGKEFQKLGERVRSYQKGLELFSEKQGIEVVNIGKDRDALTTALADFFLLRRSRRR